MSIPLPTRAAVDSATVAFMHEHPFQVAFGAWFLALYAVALQHPDTTPAKEKSFQQEMNKIREESDRPTRANVPFAFKVGTTQMPGGTYNVQNQVGTDLVMVRNVQTGTSVLAMRRQEFPSKKADKLIFHRYGSQYFLTEILGEKGSQAMVIPVTKQEKELQIAHAPTNTSTTIEIASK